MTIRYLSRDQVLELHAMQLRAFGGLSGTRDLGLLDSALGRPGMTFGGDDLYPDVGSKAAALCHSLALNHPFLDGNKRVAAHAAVLFVEMNRHAYVGSTDELADITLAVASGQVDIESLAIWFRQRLRAID